MRRKQSTLLFDETVLAWQSALKPMKRYGIALLDQQYWCWGVDIREQGNLFLRYGFEAFRQLKAEGGTCYTLYPQSSTLRLWGGNLVFGDASDGFIQLKRLEFEPRLMPSAFVLPTTIPADGAFPALADDCRRAARLVTTCWRWIADFERWVLETAGLEHRQRAVQGWKTNAVTLIDAERMAPMWDEFADDLERRMGLW